jgi:CheY-like chemotaxis protein
MGQPTVMVAEDFADTRFLLKVLLERRGCRVIEAADGLEAVKLAERERPDLILMDLNLPVLDGCAATTRIREHDALQTVPIVAVSAYLREDWEWKARARQAGFTDYVTKPLDLDQLDNLLNHHLKHSV